MDWYRQHSVTGQELPAISAVEEEPSDNGAGDACALSADDVMLDCLSKQRCQAQPDRDTEGYVEAGILAAESAT